jgi:hypothetical protein
MIFFFLILEWTLGDSYGFLVSASVKISLDWGAKKPIRPIKPRKLKKNNQINWTVKKNRLEFWKN